MLCLVGEQNQVASDTLPCRSNDTESQNAGDPGTFTERQSLLEDYEWCLLSIAAISLSTWIGLELVRRPIGGITERLPFGFVSAPFLGMGLLSVLDFVLVGSIDTIRRRWR